MIFCAVACLGCSGSASRRLAWPQAPAAPLQWCRTKQGASRVLGLVASVLQLPMAADDSNRRTDSDSAAPLQWCHTTPGALMWLTFGG
jgi:hypothetical protein